MLLYQCCVLKLHLLLVSHEIALVSMLSLDRPGHLEISPLIAHVGAPVELVREPLVVHAFLYSVNY